MAIDTELMGHPTETMTVDGFEHLGPLVVRPLTIQDSLVNIPSAADRFLPPDDMRPSPETMNGARTLGMLQVVVVEPAGFAQKLASSTNVKDLGFFKAFSDQYQAWIDSQVEEAQAKKSGTAPLGTGSEFAGKSGSTTDSSPPTQTGSGSLKPK